MAALSQQQVYANAIVDYLTARNKPLLTNELQDCFKADYGDQFKETLFNNVRVSTQVGLNYSNQYLTLACDRHGTKFWPLNLRRGCQRINLSAPVNAVRACECSSW